MSARNRRHVAAWLAVGMMFAGASLAQVRSAPGALYVPPKSESRVALLLPAGVPSRAVALDVPSSAERSAMAKGRTVPDKHAPLRIGFVRAVPEHDRRIPLASLPWQSLPDGGLAAQVTVTSATAAAVRVRLSLDGAADGTEVRFAGTAGNRQVFAGDVGKLQRAEGDWSPVLEGERAIVEVRLPPATGMAGDLVLQGIGHMVVAGPGLKRAEDIGFADSCEQDVVCTNPSQALRNAANSVAQTVVVDGANIVLCTGTILNTTPQSNAPYLLTAYHCYDLQKTRTPQQVQAVADSLSTYWFFDATACGSNVAGPYVVTGGGATLLYLSQRLDVVLFRLNAAPPPGAWFSGWDATPVVTATNAVVLHHPEGDLEKLSRGQTVGYTSFEGSGSYIELQYSTGSTEPGSSGAAMFTCGDSACSEYEVRGALTGGTAACSDPAGTDEYSRLDLAFPYIASYLAPGTAFPSGDNVGVEYYNVDLDHYFVTATAGEQNFVETGGAGPGWFRTGDAFRTLAANATSAGAMPVCRFYGSVSPGPNSHFYTLDPAECEGLKDLQAIQPATQPRWNYEGIAFANYVPGASGCPGGTIPVYRYYNNGFPVKDSNHRFVTDASVSPFMLSQGWSLEGVGMCAPAE